MSAPLSLRWRAWRARWRDHRAELAALCGALAPGDLALDVGANKGSFAYTLARRVGPRGRVVAFEPQPPLAAYLREMRERAGLGALEVVQAAVSDAPGRLVLHHPPEGHSPGASLVGGRHVPADWVGSEVDVVVIDDFLAGEARPVRALKIDVEGNEFAVLRGAEQRLLRDRPALVFECESRHLAPQGLAIGDLLEWLRARGFAGWFVERGRLRPVAEFDPARHQAETGDRFWDAPGYCNNFVFRPDAR